MPEPAPLRGSARASRFASALARAVDRHDVDVAGSIGRERLAVAPRVSSTPLAGDGGTPDPGRVAMKGEASDHHDDDDDCHDDRERRSLAVRRAQLRIRHGSVYTVSRPSRTKPQRVIPRSCASSTASEDGAPTAATRAARDRRLLHELEREPPADAEDRVGERQQPSRNAQPTTLSSALWRPTSSRTQRARPR